MRCVLVDAYAARNRHRLRPLHTQWEIISVARRDRADALEAALSGADTIVAQGFDSQLARHARTLRLLQLPQAGTENVEWPLLPLGCRVCNVYEHETPIAEFVLLAMLESRIGACRLDTEFRAGDWSASHALFGPRHGEVAGATLGLLGYGRIGRAVAQRAAAFGVTVLAVSRRQPVDPRLAWAGAVGALEEMLPRCDFLVVTCPLTPATRGLLDARRLALLPRRGVLINVARGEIVDEAALYEALASGRLAGAALDVWWQYPSPANPDVRPSRQPFHELPKLLMTPHVSGWTEAMLDRRWQVIAANLDRLARGEPLANIVAPTAEVPPQ